MIGYNSRLLKLLLLFLAILFFANSCIFDKEIKQDARLNFFRARIHVVLDSLDRCEDRIPAFDSMVAQINRDAGIFSLRKRNLLLTEVYYNLGNEYYTLGSFSKAIDVLSVPIAMNHDNAVAFYNRGCAYQSADSLDKAENDYAKAVALKGDYADAYYNRALVYESKKDYGKALSDLKKVISLNTTYKIDAILKSGAIYAAMGDFTQAENCFDRAFACEPDNPDVYFFKAELFKSLNKRDSALEMYNKILTRDSLNLSAHRLRAELYESLGYKKNADSDIREIMRISSEKEKLSKQSSIKKFDRIKKTSDLSSRK